MSKCIDCGANFVGTPEQPPPEGMRCKSCEITRLKAELAKAQAEKAKMEGRLKEVNWNDRCLWEMMHEQPPPRGVYTTLGEIVAFVQKLKDENARLRGALGTAIELLDRYSAAVHCLSLDREPEVEEQVKGLREVYQSNPEQSILSAAVEKARGGPAPPKEYQGFA